MRIALGCAGSTSILRRRRLIRKSMARSNGSISQNVRVQANTHDVICEGAVACHVSETSTEPSRV